MTDTIYKAFAAHVSCRPDALAVEDEAFRLTYRQLDAAAAAIQQLIPAGAKRVGVVMEHGVDLIAAIFGILRAGAAYVPAEPSFPTDRVLFMLEDSDVEFLITQDAYVDRYGGIPHAIVDPGFAVENTVVREDSGFPIPEPAAVSGFDLAYILYTSGSTGLPKGVAIEQHNVLHYAHAFNHEFVNGPTDRMLQHSPCSFDIFVEEVFASLLNGSAVVVPSAATRHDNVKLMDFVEAHGVTIISGFPYLFMELNDRPTLPRSLRLLISGGDVLRARYISNLVDRIAIYNTYGPSEATVCSNYFRCNPGNELDDGTYPVGHPVLGTQTIIMDENLEPVSRGSVGEICISGGGVGRGYVGNASRRSESFIVYEDGSRLYRTGDLGYELDSGDIAFVGRKDSQVMVWGRRVEPNGVETVLCSYDGVKTGVVRAYLDEHGLASYLVAYYVANGDVTEEELREYMARKLPGYMIPERFAQLTEIPLNSNGKVDSQALPKIDRVQVGRPQPAKVSSEM